jgi:hypothetical protein
MSLVSFSIGLSVAFMTLIILKIISQLFCRMFLELPYLLPSNYIQACIFGRNLRSDVIFFFSILCILLDGGHFSSISDIHFDQLLKVMTIKLLHFKVNLFQAGDMLKWYST